MRLRPYFLVENKGLIKALRAFGFHTALCYHPSILFEEKSTEKVSPALIRPRVCFLRKCLEQGLLKNEQGYQLINESGIQPYFKNGTGFWLQEKYSTYSPYSIPDSPDYTGRIVVYSVITGFYDNIQEVLFKEDNADYLLFTNNPNLKSKTWRIIQVESELNDILLSREIKMLPHQFLDEKYDISIYVDANVVIYGEISQLNRFLNDRITLAVSKHGERDTVKEEIKAIHSLKHIDLTSMNKQYDQYVKRGFHDDLGLAECTVLVRRHKDKELISLMEAWWDEFKNGVYRDQISLMPVIYFHDFRKYCLMPGYVMHNQFCRALPHKRSC